METIDKLIDTRELQQALEDLANDVREGYKDKLLREDHKATGDLLNSVTAYVEVQGTTYEVKLELLDYWKYLEDGTRPHWPPRSAILKWIKAKPVVPYPGKDGRIPSPESLAFLIQRKIARVGTKGTHGLRETTESIIPYWLDRLKEILGRAYGNYIQSIVAFPNK